MKNILVMTIAAFWLLAALLTFTVRPAHAQSKNGLCLTEPEFTDVNAMGQTDEQRLQAIRDWLDGRLPKSPSGGFLKGTITNPDGSRTPYTFDDLDGKPTDPAEEISNAAKNNKINPRVLLTTLRKEQPSVFKSTIRPDDRILRRLAGCGIKGSPTAREQIQCMAQQFKRDYYDRLSQCIATGPPSLPDPNRWQVDVVRLAGDAPGDESDALGETCPVQPSSKGVAALYAYTPWGGAAVGCGQPAATILPGEEPPPLVGGNGLFCQFWAQHGWEAPPGPLALSPQPLTMSCAPSTPQQPSRCLSINASGGTPPYTWTNTKGVITISGVNQQNIQLKPPENRGSGLAGNAYGRKVAQVDGNTCAHNPGFWETTAMFGCNDNFLTCPSGNPAGAAFLQSCAAGAGECGQLICGLPKCACLSPTQNPGEPATCDIAKSNGVVHDVRTQGPDCRPCRLEMQGATVTVTDAAGPPVSTPVAVQ